MWPIDLDYENLKTYGLICFSGEYWSSNEAFSFNDFHFNKKGACHKYLPVLAK